MRWFGLLVVLLLVACAEGGSGVPKPELDVGDEAVDSGGEGVVGGAEAVDIVSGDLSADPDAGQVCMQHQTRVLLP